VYAARDLLEVAEGSRYEEKLNKVVAALDIAVNGKPNMEDDDAEEYTLGEILFDL